MPGVYLCWMLENFLTLPFELLRSALNLSYINQKNGRLVIELKLYVLVHELWQSSRNNLPSAHYLKLNSHSPVPRDALLGMNLYWDKILLNVRRV